MAGNPRELVLGNGARRSLTCRAALAKLVFAVWCCVIGSEKLFPQYMHQFEPRSKPRSAVREKQLSVELCVRFLELCVRCQPLLHCLQEMALRSFQSIFLQMIQEGEGL